MDVFVWKNAEGYKRLKLNLWIMIHFEFMIETREIKIVCNSEQMTGHIGIMNNVWVCFH